MACGTSRRSWESHGEWLSIADLHKHTLVLRSWVAFCFTIYKRLLYPSCCCCQFVCLTTESSRQPNLLPLPLWELENRVSGNLESNPELHFFICNLRIVSIDLKSCVMTQLINAYKILRIASGIQYYTETNGSWLNWTSLFCAK